MTGVIYVLTCTTDPFVPGGVPFAAFIDNQSAWDRLAEEAAMHAQIVWDNPNRRRGRTRDQVMAAEAGCFDVHLVLLHELMPSWWPGEPQDFPSVLSRKIHS